MIVNNNNPSDKRVYPTRWDTKRGKALFAIKDLRSENGSEELLSVSHITGITPRSQKNITMFKSESLVGYKLCNIGDIAANTMWTWQGAIGVSKYDGVVSPAYNVYCVKKDYYNLKYLDYLLREKGLVDVYHSISTGIQASRLRLYPDAFLTINFPIPPHEEQEQIVSYLEWQTSKTNKLISKLKLQISLLEEKKQAIINKAVIRGLDNSPELRDSGNEHIGFIPKDWTICEIRYKAKIYNGNSISDSDKDKYEEPTSIPYIATKDIEASTGFVNYENGLYVPEESDFKIAPAESTLLCIEGGSAGRKKAYISNKVAFVNKLCAFVAQNINPKYLYFYLCSNAFTNQFSQNITGLIGGVSLNTIKQLLIIVPDNSMQSAIADYLDEQCSLHNALIERLNRKIALLQEYKNRLISDVVTGKVDVREIQIPEYEYVEEKADEESDEIDNMDDESEEQEE